MGGKWNVQKQFAWNVGFVKQRLTDETRHYGCTKGWGGTLSVALSARVKNLCHSLGSGEVCAVTEQGSNVILHLVIINLQAVCKTELNWSRSVVSDSLRPRGPTRLLCPWNSPGKNTAVGCHFLLQGIFPTQGLNPGLPHCRQTL